MAREFDVEVWAADLWVAASENWRRVRDAGVHNRVFPLHVDARALPFAAEFFDAIAAHDCYGYFGTDDLYLNYLAQFVKPRGQIGIAGAGLVAEISVPVPDHLREFWTQDVWTLHSADWWRRHWERTGIVEIEAADTMPDGGSCWLRWQREAWPDNTDEINVVAADAGRNLTYVRLVGRRREDVKLAEYCWPDTMRAMPFHHEEKAMLRA
jgi:SAM-dependent methyltransferase